MPVTPTYPGVYIEELPSGVRTITGVSTSVAAFIGYFERGPMNDPVQVFSFADFERAFGGLARRSEASYAIRQFFLNGGSEAWVVRTAGGSVQEADVEILSAIAGATALTATAREPGTWGNQVIVRIDYPGPVSNNRFNLTVSLFEDRRNTRVQVRSETFHDLSMDPSDPRFVETVVNDDLTGSELIEVSASGTDRPLQNGTLSGVLDPFPTLSATEPQMDVTIGTEGTATAVLADVPTSLSEARTLLQSAIRGADPTSAAFSQATVTVVDSRLRVLAGPTRNDSTVSFATVPPDATAGDFGLLAPLTRQGVLSGDIAGAFPHGGGSLNVSIGGTGPFTLTLGAMADLEAARSELETQIRAADGATRYTQARVVAHTEGAAERLIVLAGDAGESVDFTQEGGDATVSDLGLDGGTASDITATVSEDLAPVPAVPAGAEVDVQIGGEGPHTATLAAAPGGDLEASASSLQQGIRNASGAAAFTGARVGAYDSGGENRLVILAAGGTDAVTFADTAVDNTTAAELLLDSANAQSNVQTYALGAGGAIAGTAQGAAQPGDPGSPPGASEIIGDEVAKTGIWALEDVDLFNLLVIPRAALVSGPDALDPVPANAANQAAAIRTAAADYCHRRRAFLILDTPNNIDEVDEVKEWLEQNVTRRRNVAFYFPRVRIPDPLNDFRSRTVGAAGTMAGIYARTDASRGVWKAPAGTEATLVGVRELEYKLSDGENGTLNPLAINALRNFPVIGSVAWGARTLEGADQLASEWKYIPIRRLALFIEESLYRGTQWVVFEPNDEPLWAQIRLNVGSFMQNLFRQGAFQGQTPREAYLVKCDRETTTQDDIDRGVVNILVGFAPLKPAEFVIIQIQQLAGRDRT